MPKSSKKQINIDENKVITELQKNAKESIDKIAKNCGFSRQKVWRIIKRLEENRTIWGYCAVVDNEKINMKGYILLARLSHLPFDNGIEKDMVERTVDKLGVQVGVIVEDSFWLNGSFDYMISFSAKDLKMAKKFQEIFIRVYNSNISELKLMEKMVTIKKDGFVSPKIVDTKKLL